MKQLRHEKILSLIAKYPIETQEEIQQRLRDCGYEVTQATVSRDIKKLRLLKTLDENGKYRYTASPSVNSAASHAENILSGSVLNVDYAMNDVVIKCRIGMAMAACAVLDEMNLDLVVGTLAGDDTIFVVTRHEEAARMLCKKLEEITATAG